MTSTAAARPGLRACAAATVLFVGLADALFFGHPTGITLALFMLILAAAVVALHPTAIRSRWLVFKAGMLLAATLPLCENVSPLSSSIAFVALAAFALSVAGRLRPGIARIAGQAMAFFLMAPFRFLADAMRWLRGARRAGSRQPKLATAAVWIMPLGLGAIFLALFGAANPVIEYWLSLIDLLTLLELVDVARIGFWLFVLAAVWAFLRPRLPRFLRHGPLPASPGLAVPPATGPETTIEGLVFGRAAILRALVVFNLLFAVQTLLDMTYLWGGAALPDGLSYAAYAHRGAYPLIVTALLAAGFVLAAMRPGSATSGDPLIRRLVYLFVAQNILLVVSSILRLDLYVSIYALTYWRVAAFIWMGLVAAGLALIIARIALGKSSEWLLPANLLSLSATLYACSFVNVAALIANYNVDHSFEMTGKGLALDIYYLRSLGTAAFPAMDRLLDRQQPTDGYARDELAAMRAVDEAWLRRTHEDWRAWTFRDHRLLDYLQGRPPLPPALFDLPTPD